MKTLLLLTMTFCVPLFAQGAEYSLWEDSNAAPFAAEPVPPGHGLSKLVTMTSDRDASATVLNALVNSTNEIAGVYNSPTTLMNSGTLATERNVFWLSEIESADGALMLEKQGRKVLFLQGKLDRGTQEGRFKVRFLTNGLFGRYDSCDFLLKKAGTNWFVQNAYTGQRVTEVKVLTHSLGITTLQGFCPEK
jgi:hypothetical protein